MIEKVTLNITSMDMYEEEIFTPQIEILDGDFVEGGTVTVRICGKEFTRKVKYSAKKYGDLYITVNGYEFTYTEFYAPEEFRDCDYSVYLK